MRNFVCDNCFTIAVDNNPADTDMVHECSVCGEIGLGRIYSELFRHFAWMCKRNFEKSVDIDEIDDV